MKQEINSRKMSGKPKYTEIKQHISKLCRGQKGRHREIRKIKTKLYKLGKHDKNIYHANNSESNTQN